MNLLLFGPPGAGKGTQSENLIEKYGMIQISTGDLLRNAIKNQNKFGLEAKASVDRGQLVPDELVTSMVQEAIKYHFSQKNFSGLILDGYPRTLDQARALENIFFSVGRKIDRAIFIKLESDIIIQRLVGRRVCKACGSVYHVRDKKPEIVGKCDKCEGELVHRTDDKEDVIKSRLEIFFRAEDDLANFYKKLGLYCEIDGLGSSDEVFNRLIGCLK